MEKQIEYLLSLKRANLMRMRDLLLTNDIEELKRTKHSHDLIDREIMRINNKLVKPYPLHAFKIDDLYMTKEKSKPIKEDCIYGNFKTLEQEESELLPKIQYEQMYLKKEIPKQEKMLVKEDNDNSQDNYLDQMYTLYD